jgi:hypothetical protein
MMWPVSCTVSQPTHHIASLLIVMVAKINMICPASLASTSHLLPVVAEYDVTYVRPPLASWIGKQDCLSKVEALPALALLESEGKSCHPVTSLGTLRNVWRGSRGGSLGTKLEHHICMLSQFLPTRLTSSAPTTTTTLRYVSSNQ